MKVILLQDVRKVGKKNEVVEVSQGYANNFLFKQNLAVEADKAQMRQLKKRMNADQAKYDEEVKAAKQMKKDIESREFVFQLKAGKGGVTFGSISSKQINLELQKAGFKVDKRKIKGEPISHIGYDKVEVELHKEVTATIKVKVEEK